MVSINSNISMALFTLLYKYHLYISNYSFPVCHISSTEKYIVLIKRPVTVLPQLILDGEIVDSRKLKFLFTLF